MASLNSLVCVDDFEHLARQNVSQAVIDNITCPAGEGITMNDNRNAFKRYGHFVDTDLPLRSDTMLEIEQVDSTLTWEVIDWLKSVTKLPIIGKGILTAEDALEAVKHGVAGILVSNHGGRQLDSVMSTIDALPEVVEAVKGSGVEVYMDGGVRNGTDVLKALAFGAKAVFIGRPVLWGLACDGEEGVKRVLEILQKEFEIAMANTGCRSVAEINGRLVQRSCSCMSLTP